MMSPEQEQVKKYLKEWPLDRALGDAKFSPIRKEPKLTKVMKSQLLEYLHDIEQKGDYWGNKDQFWARHEKIKEWVKAQE